MAGHVATYDYPDEQARVLLRKKRYEPKSFRMQARKAEGCVWVEPSHFMERSERARAYFHSLLFNLPLLLDRPAEVALTEGEKDAEAVTAAGLPALSHWGGAQRFTVEQAERFRRYRGRVVLITDNDAAGAADALLRYERLRAVGIPSRRLFVVRARAGKDAADHLAAGFAVAQFRPVSLDRLRAVAATAPPPRTTALAYDAGDWAVPVSAWKPRALRTGGPR